MGQRGSYTYVYATHWNRIYGSFDLEPGVRGIRISPICFSDNGVFSVLIDDIYLGDGVGATIFFNGFETGTTEHWDTTSP